MTKLKEINWLYVDVKPDKVEQSMDDVVIEVANSATSSMVEKVTDQSGYTAGIQAYTLRNLDTFKPNVADIDQFKMRSQEMSCAFQTFSQHRPTGRFGEFHPRDEHLAFSEYVKSRLNNKGTEKVASTCSTSCIFNVLKNTSSRDIRLSK